MNRRHFVQASTTASLGFALQSKSRGPILESPETGLLSRGLLVYVDERLRELDNFFLESLRSASQVSPLLRVLSGAKTFRQLSSSALKANKTNELAYNHVLLIGFIDDALLQQAWQREATISPGSIYAFGFGSFRGSLGYIESDRNPFLHAANIAKAPYESELITITGTDTEGIKLAFNAFVTQGLAGGVVTKPGSWNRISESLLDHDPLEYPFTLPSIIPHSLDKLDRIAILQASEDEYRGVLADTGHRALSIWRVKYYGPGQWDGAGEVSSFRNYNAGLHRRAYGNTVWVSEFSDQSVAAASANLISKSAGLKRTDSRWQGTLPAYAWGLPEFGDSPNSGALELWVNSNFVLISTLLN